MSWPLRQHLRLSKKFREGQQDGLGGTDTSLHRRLPVGSMRQTLVWNTVVIVASVLQPLASCWQCQAAAPCCLLVINIVCCPWFPDLLFLHSTCPCCFKYHHTRAWQDVQPFTDAGYVFETQPLRCGWHQGHMKSTQVWVPVSWATQAMKL